MKPHPQAAKAMLAAASDAAQIEAAFKRPPPHWTEIRMAGIPSTKAFEYGGLRVLSQLVFANGDKNLPEWRISVIRGKASRPDDDDIARCLRAFEMAGAVELPTQGADTNIRTFCLSVVSKLTP